MEYLMNHGHERTLQLFWIGGYDGSIHFRVANDFSALLIIGTRFCPGNRTAAAVIIHAPDQDIVGILEFY